MNTLVFRGLYVLGADRFRRFRRAIAVGLLTTGGLLLLAVLAKLLLDIPYELLFRDALVVAEAPAYYGAMSQLGVFFWWVTVGALGVLLALRSRLTDARTAMVPYALGLTLVLALDDAFMLHEAVPTIGPGISSTLLVYGGLLGGYLLTNLRVLPRTPFPLLLLSLGCLGGSLACDEVPQYAMFVSRDATFFIEDGLKLGGIVFWALYHLMLGRSIISKELYGRFYLSEEESRIALDGLRVESADPVLQ